MKKLLATAALALPLMASAQLNLLVNGSFESGFSSWTASTAGTFPASVVTYPSGSLNFNNAVTANTLTSPSTDPIGTRAVYFVDDSQVQTVFQTVAFVTPGTYFVGFDYFIPVLGAANPAPSTVFAAFGSTFASVSTTSTPGVWTPVRQLVTITSPNAYTFSFSFVPTGGAVAGEDILIDRAYVVAVPEPSTYGMLLAGLVGVGLFARRRAAQR